MLIRQLVLGLDDRLITWWGVVGLHKTARSHGNDLLSRKGHAIAGSCQTRCCRALVNYQAVMPLFTPLSLILGGVKRTFAMGSSCACCPERLGLVA